MFSNLTICLSIYNGKKYLYNQMDSLFAQSVQNFTLLIRDDKSTDDGMKIIKEYQLRYPNRIRFIHDSMDNFGSQKSFMKLLEYTDSPYIMFCDQDDVWMPTKVEASLTKIQELEKIYGADIPLLVFTDMKVVDANLKTIHNSFWNYQKLDPEITHQWKTLLAQNVITGCTIILNQAAKKASLPFEVETMMHDHWIGVNVAKYGKIGYLRSPTVLYRQHGANVEGAYQYGWSYIIFKLKSIHETIHKLYLSASHFNVSFGRLLLDKVTINIERLLKRV